MASRLASKTIKIALLAAVAGFFGVVVFCSYRPLRSPLAPLEGVSVAPAAPTWDWSSLRSGATAKSLGNWFDARVGLRSFWVRLDNQINYSLFGEITKRTAGTQLINGPGDWFYEKQYIDYSITPGTWSDQEALKVITRLRRVQDKLARRGIPLLLVIGPSKVETYPEHVPAKVFAGRSPTQVTTNFEHSRQFLRQADVNFVDGPALFTRWKQEGVGDLFARSGTHWSYHSALRIWEEIRTQLNPQLRHPIPDFIVPPAAPAPPASNDRDLLNLANLLISRPYEHDLPKPTPVAQHTVPTEDLPRLLWVHDSFGWPLIELIYQANAAQPTESLYYFNSCLRIPGATPTTTDPKQIEWTSFLAPYDAVVLVWTEIAFDFDSCGFIEALDNGLD